MIFYVEAYDDPPKQRPEPDYADMLEREIEKGLRVKINHLKREELKNEIHS